jgi:hypothetical protein
LHHTCHCFADLRFIVDNDGLDHEGVLHEDKVFFESSVVSRQSSVKTLEFII